MLSEEQVIELKNQLKAQITHLSPEKRIEAENQIDSLSSEALESMLNEQRSSRKDDSDNKSIFRRIIDGDIPSVKISENLSASAFLDITPVSKGNCIIIPKKAVNDAKKMPTGAFTLAKKISSRIISKLGAKTTEIQTENRFGEAYISIIPSYDKPLNINSPRKSAKIEELEIVAEILRVKKRNAKLAPKPEPKEKKQESFQIPRRIP